MQHPRCGISHQENTLQVIRWVYNKFSSYAEGSSGQYTPEIGSLNLQKVLTGTRRIFIFTFYIDTENYTDLLYIGPDIHGHSLVEIKARQGREDNERNMNNDISMNTFKIHMHKTLVEYR